MIAGGASDPEKIGYLAVAALCAYAFGLVTNDIADLKTDTAERPARPLPSGEISMKEASIAAVVLLHRRIGADFFARAWRLFRHDAASGRDSAL